MNRNSLLETAGRSMHQAVRLVLNKAINDNPLMQEMGFAGMAGGDIRGIVERFQAYGMTSVPLGPSKAKGGSQGGSGGSSQGGIGSQSVGVEALAAGGGGGGAGGGGGGGQEGAAEGIALFLGGQRNHPVVIAVDDRRHRPMGLKPGENAQYDDLGQMTLARRDGLYLLSNDNPEEEGGESKERMVSLRHVEKKKQERQKPQSGGSQGGSGGGSAKGAGTFAANGGGQKTQTPDHSNYKHEGETINTELRVTKKKIEFRNGDEVIADHEKSSNKWNFKGKEHHVTSSDKHSVTSQQVGITGTTVAINGATSINGSPVATTATLQSHFELVAALEARIAALEARLGP
jgi:phage gp45-like